MSAKFSFPYAQHAEEAMRCVPQCVRSTPGADAFSDYLLARMALAAARRVAPVYDPEKGVPWEIFFSQIFRKDLKNALERKARVSDEELALVLIDAAWEEGL